MFPGPRMFAASRLPYVCIALSGRMASALKDLHDTYGPVVRTAPDELSFIDSSAWNAIYGQHHPSKPRFRKNYDKFEQNQTELAASIFVANDEDHHRMRRVLAHAFSERALRDQEPLIESHVNSLIQGLHNQVANAAGQVDLVKWFNWVAFDIVADLSFGEPFNCLKGPEYRSWVETLSKAWKIFTFVSSFKSIAPSDAISRFLIPKTLIQNQLNHFDIVINRVKRRIAFDSGRPDFISSIIQHNSKKAMSGTELLSNASTLIAAGTETVASVLPGITYLLVKHPEVMLRAVNEVRSKFDNEEAVCIQSVNSLVYLSAVLNEALRLYPAVPEGLPRVTPPSGCIISGNWVPGGVSPITPR